ncbi:MAG: glycosyltransferase family protein, partial [Thermoguttaceae bacterium]
IVHSDGGENAQRTYSLRAISFRHPWVYNPDADEVTPPDLRDEMLDVVSDGSRSEVAYRVRFKNMFMGRWVRHSSLYPTWVVRLFRPDCISFERSTNLTYVVKGKEGRLRSHFLHHSFDKGLQAWFEKHARYARHEAWETIRDLDSGHMDWFGLLAIRNPVRRRAAWKQLSFRVPCRPTMRFAFAYLLRRGFLDGAPGYHFCRLMAVYEAMVDLQVRELRLTRERSGRVHADSQSPTEDATRVREAATA